MNDDNRAEWFERFQAAQAERMARELWLDLGASVAAGDMTADEANEWYNRKVEQWARGMS